MYDFILKLQHIHYIIILSLQMINTKSFFKFISVSSYYCIIEVQLAYIA
jgi:hypothetical protein